jgi:hypothetical protein
MLLALSLIFVCDLLAKNPRSQKRALVLVSLCDDFALKK